MLNRVTSNRHLSVRACALVIFLGVICATGCFDNETPEERLNAARAKWTRVGPTSYSLTLSFWCSECGIDERLVGPALIEVRDGKIASRTYASSGNVVVAPYDTHWLSIEELFTLIDSAVRKDEPYGAEYDPKLGYPTRIELRQGLDFVYTVTDLKLR